MIKMRCQCGDQNVLDCTCCRQNFVVKLTGLSSSIKFNAYDSLYGTKVDILSFGHLMLDTFVGRFVEVRMISGYVFVLIYYTYAGFISCYTNKK